ncbi:hypothetical protein [Variovorax sp. UMC13]|uniref:hypothetical protein n=1 Tax=Variovorax sp. UMC13 TaxID=1862326 RepID=UPI0016011606|nr:hypothetical protein [Variovorax sp. UMC13]MBB1599526.1 hypothetical protein [Variovorax sp. UMC13]
MSVPDWMIDTPQASVDDLAALVRRLARSLRKAAPDNALPDQALDYLRRHGLEASILRATPPQATLPASETVELVASYRATADGFEKITTRAQAQADAAEPVGADLWYLQDTRQFVGNDVLWWAKDGRGYTTDLSKAHAFGAAEAARQEAARGVDRAWPKAYIDAKARPAVDFQHINHAEALAAQAPAVRGGEQQ